MSIKRKMFLIVIGCFGAMIAIYASLSQRAYRWTMEAIAEQDSRHTFNHALQLIRKDLTYLDLLASDWAEWDDAYDYVLSPTEAFRESNFQDITFENIHVSFFTLFDAKGSLLFSYPSRLLETEKRIVTELREKTASAGEYTSVRAIGENYYYFAAHPIRRSDGSGPEVGTLIFGRNAIAESIPELSKILDAEITFAPISPDLPHAITLLRVTNSQYAVIGPLVDSTGDTDVFLRVHPEATNITIKISTYLPLIAVGLGSLGGLVGFMVFILNRLIVRRIVRIDAELEPAARLGSYKYRVTVDGRDEITKLGATLNETFTALEKSFSERDSLFKEIRHRVKNNLQVVASLLSLQANEAVSPGVSQALLNSQRRVLAMAFVHEELYSSESMDAVDLKEYLNRLAFLVRYALDPQESIRFISSIEGAFLSIERAVPFALIANEALNNAFRHAFDPAKAVETREEKSIEMSARVVGLNIVYELTDTGRGIENDDIKAGGTLGITLIEALSQQLRGKFSYEKRPEGGTLFRLVFSIEQKDEKAY